MNSNLDELAFTVAGQVNTLHVGGFGLDSDGEEDEMGGDGDEDEEEVKKEEPLEIDDI